MRDSTPLLDARKVLSVYQHAERLLEKRVGDKPAPGMLTQDLYHLHLETHHLCRQIEVHAVHFPVIRAEGFVRLARDFFSCIPKRYRRQWHAISQKGIEKIEFPPSFLELFDHINQAQIREALRCASGVVLLGHNERPLMERYLGPLIDWVYARLMFHEALWTEAFDLEVDHGSRFPGFSHADAGINACMTAIVGSLFFSLMGLDPFTNHDSVTNLFRSLFSDVQALKVLAGRFKVHALEEPAHYIDVLLIGLMHYSRQTEGFEGHFLQLLKNREPTPQHSDVVPALDFGRTWKGHSTAPSLNGKVLDAEFSGLMIDCLKDTVDQGVDFVLKHSGLLIGAVQGVVYVLENDAHLESLHQWNKWQYWFKVCSLRSAYEARAQWLDEHPSIERYNPLKERAEKLKRKGEPAMPAELRNASELVKRWMPGWLSSTLGWGVSLGAWAFKRTIKAQAQKMVWQTIVGHCPDEEFKAIFALYDKGYHPQQSVALCPDKDDRRVAYDAFCAGMLPRTFLTRSDALLLEYFGAQMQKLFPYDIPPVRMGRDPITSVWDFRLIACLMIDRLKGKRGSGQLMQQWRGDVMRATHGWTTPLPALYATMVLLLAWDRQLGERDDDAARAIRLSATAVRAKLPYMVGAGVCLLKAAPLDQWQQYWTGASWMRVRGMLSQVPLMMTHLHQRLLDLKGGVKESRVVLLPPSTVFERVCPEMTVEAPTARRVSYGPRLLPPDVGVDVRIQLPRRALRLRSEAQWRLDAIYGRLLDPRLDQPMGQVAHVVRRQRRQAPDQALLMAWLMMRQQAGRRVSGAPATQAHKVHALVPAEQMVRVVARQTRPMSDEALLWPWAEERVKVGRSQTHPLRAKDSAPSKPVYRTRIPSRSQEPKVQWEPPRLGARLVIGYTLGLAVSLALSYCCLPWLGALAALLWVPVVSVVALWPVRVRLESGYPLLAAEFAQEAVSGDRGSLHAPARAPYAGLGL